MSTAITMYIAVLLLTSWLPAHWKRRIVGVGLIADISVHVILQTMFGGDANGRAGLLLAGVLVNITMHAYRNWAGYEVIAWRDVPTMLVNMAAGEPSPELWIRHPGRWAAKVTPTRTTRKPRAAAAKPKAPSRKPAKKRTR